MPELTTITSEVDDHILAIEYEIARKLKAIKKTESEKTVLSENEKVKIENEYRFIRNVRTLISSFRNSMKANLGKIPPNAVDLEESILGAIMLEKLAMPVVARFLKPDHFYKEVHCEIYATILDMYNNSVPIDMRTVVLALRKNGKIDLIGGAHYIAELTMRVTSAANIEYHARMVVEFAIKRSLIVMSAQLLQDAYEDTSDCFKLYDNAEKELNRIGEWRKK